MGALWNLAAIVALNHRRVGAPVPEDKSLTSLLHILFKGINELLGEGALHFAHSARFYCIYNLHIGSRSSKITEGQHHPCIFFYGDIVERLKRGCCRAHYKMRTIDGGQKHSGISGIISWRGVGLLIAWVVLLIHNNKPQLRKWQKERGACTQHHHR